MMKYTEYMFEIIRKKFDCAEIFDCKNKGVEILLAFDKNESPIYAISHDYKGPFEDYYGLGTISKYEDEYCYCCQDAITIDLSSPNQLLKELINIVRADNIKAEYKEDIIEHFKEDPKLLLI